MNGLIPLIYEHTIMFTILIQIVLVFIFLASISLISKFVLKLRWLISICIAILSLTALFVLGKFGLMRGSVGYFVVLISALVCALILVVQFFQWLFSASASQSFVNPEERSRILKMVEDGKISVDEGKELLDAIGKSSALRGEEKFTRVDIGIIAGVGLIVLGFFLPWVYVQLPNISDFSFFNSTPGYQAGYNTGAIGWTILIIAIASVIPVFVTPRNLLYKISMLQIFLLIIGVVLIIIVLVLFGENLGAGLVFCLAGFIVAFIASIAKLKSLAA